MTVFGLGDLAFLGAAGGVSVPLLLDQFPGARAAYSFRNLRTGVTNVIRVRRSSDNSEQDFTAAQVADGTLTTFCGAGNGFVRTWYDQSGNDNHATRTDSSTQPTIVSNGSLVTHNGKPAIQFTGGLCRLNMNSFANQSRLDLYIVKNTSDTEYIFCTGTGDQAFSWVATSGSPNTTLTLNYGGSLYANGQLFTGATRGQVFSFLNGYKLEVHEGVITTSGQYNGVFMLGGYSISAGLDFIGIVQEVVGYASNQSSNRNSIKSSINAHYGIY